MDDVFGQVVLAGGNENLGSGQAVSIVRLRNGLGAQQAEIRAAVRLRKTHGAGPLTRLQFGQIKILRGLVRMPVDRVIGPVRQTRIHAPGQIGRPGHFVHAHAQHVGETLAAVGGITIQGGPAPFTVGLVSLLETFRRGHHAVTDVAAFLIATAIQREQFVLRELAGFFQDLVHELGSCLLMARQCFHHSSHLEHFVQNKAHVAYRCLINRHVRYSLELVVSA